MREYTLSITRKFQASREEVFDAFEHAAAWWAPPSCSVASASVDFRVGGQFRIGMAVPDGKLIFVHGEYKTIDRPARLVFTHVFEQNPPCGTELADHETLVTVELVRDGDATELRFVQEKLPSEEAVQRNDEGFGEILESLDRFLAAARSADAPGFARAH